MPYRFCGLLDSCLAAIERPATAKPVLFAKHSDEELLGYGVPVDWLNDVRQATEDTILELADHLPGEAAEALLDLAVGVTPKKSEPVDEGIDPFHHPDAQRRFRVMNNVEELAQALDYPWEKWTVFLHPEQRQMVERDYNGPAKVSGSAGTGKTIVALHRAVFLARKHPEARVLLTTFSDTLANALSTKLKRLIITTPRLGERLEVHALDAIGQRLFEFKESKVALASRPVIRQLLETASKNVTGHKFSLHFLLTEWDQVVDAWQLDSWESYRDVKRLGRKTRLPEPQRQLLWSIFDQVRTGLISLNLITRAEMFTRLANYYSENIHPPFDFVVVDESQDIDVAQLRFLAALTVNRINGLFFAGDLGQRIFQQAFSWKSLGVDIRGRSRTLHINYRTSHQIRLQADHLLGPSMSDVDGNIEDRKGTVSVFNGSPPAILMLATPEDEIKSVSQWLIHLSGIGIKPQEMGVFVRSESELERAISAVSAASLNYKALDAHVETVNGHVSICTMHLAKGLEFRAVVVMACDDEIIPSQQRIETVKDDADLEDVYETERHLLYVACTRA